MGSTAKKSTSSAPNKPEPGKRLFSHMADYFEESARDHAAGSIKNVNLALLAKDAREYAATFDGKHTSAWHPPAVGNTKVSKLKAAPTAYKDPNPEPTPEDESTEESTEDVGDE